MVTLKWLGGCSTNFKNISTLFEPFCSDPFDWAY